MSTHPADSTPASDRVARPPARGGGGAAREGASPDPAVAAGARAAMDDVFDDLVRRGLTLAVAESCTGGLFAAMLTDRPGASAILREGLVVYSNAAKMRRLGIDGALLEEFGAVSIEAAAAMADSLLDSSDADLTAAVTGIAGPGGATPLKPVGTVAFAVASRHARRSDLARFDGDRTTVRAAACRHLARLLLDPLADAEAWPSAPPSTPPAPASPPPASPRP